MRYIAFLRAINVGGHTVKMEQLRDLFESLGPTNVATVIRQSDSKFSNAVLEKTLKQPSTLRGMDTIKRIAEKYCAGSK